MRKRLVRLGEQPHWDVNPADALFSDVHCADVRGEHVWLHVRKLSGTESVLGVRVQQRFPGPVTGPRISVLERQQLWT